VAQVFTGRGAVAATLLVLGFGNAALLLALSFSPWPVIEIMSGARHDEIHSAHVSIVGGTFCLAVLAVPALVVLALFYLPFGILGRRRKPRKNVYPALRKDADTPATRGLWVLAVLSVLAWLPLLPFTQPPLEGQPTQWDMAREDRQNQRAWWDERTARGSVLKSGEQLRLFNDDASLLITAESRLERRYTWADHVISAKLATHPAEHSGDELWFELDNPAPGVTRVSIMEGTRYFETEAKALEWLQSREIGLRWTRDGLAGAWSFTDGRLTVELWQVHIAYSKPGDLPDASDGWFIPKR
jgi:hypothetical protein